jgi:hypothetical protein
VVAYGGTLQLSLLDRTESASPPRAEPCARAPLSPPVAPASYFLRPALLRHAPGFYGKPLGAGLSSR